MVLGDAREKVDRQEVWMAQIGAMIANLSRGQQVEVSNTRRPGRRELRRGRRKEYDSDIDDYEEKEVEMGWTRNRDDRMERRGWNNFGDKVDGNLGNIKMAIP